MAAGGEGLWGTARRGDCMMESMATLADVTAALEDLAPLRLAAEWDAVGLLLGSRRPRVGRILTCLTLTGPVAREAIDTGVDLVVSHHPLPFRPVGRITDATPTGAILLDLAAAGIAVWSSHTAWDSAAGGINDQLAERCGLSAVAPLVADPVAPRAGFGRMGLAGEGTTLAALATRLARSLSATGPLLVGDGRAPVGRVGIVCGSGADGIGKAHEAGCDTFLTGELKLHEALHAAAIGMKVIAVGHHASERFSMPVLGERLAARVAGVECRSSVADVDPFTTLDGA